jgi:hypothetical protein
LKELDRFDVLHHRQWLINWMFSRDCPAICTNSSERHVRLKRPFVDLPEDLQKRCAQCGNFIRSHTVRPEQTRLSRLRTVTDMLEDQPESAKSVGTPPSFSIAPDMKSSFHGGTRVR